MKLLSYKYLLIFAQNEFSNSTPMFACCRKPEPEVELDIRTKPKPTKTTFREGSNSPKVIVQQSNLTKQIVTSLENNEHDVK